MPIGGLFTPRARRTLEEAVELCSGYLLVVTRLTRGTIPTASIARENAAMPPAIQLERGAIEERLAVTSDHIERGVRTVHAYLELLGNAPQLFDLADDSARRLLLEAFFKRIYLDAEDMPRGDLHESAEIAVGMIRIEGIENDAKKPAHAAETGTDTGRRGPEDTETQVGSLGGGPLSAGLSSQPWLGYLDSNQEQLNQNQPCCQLHHTPMAAAETGPTDHSTAPRGPRSQAWKAPRIAPIAAYETTA